MKQGLLLTFTVLFFLFFSNLVFAQETSNKGQKYVGELFDVQVPRENYLFVKSAMAVFGNRWGPQPKTSEQQEEYIWEQLLLSYEAFRRGVTVTGEEIDAEITKILQAENAGFDWKSDKDAFEKWVREKTNEPTELFKNQIRHLLEIEKLRQQVMNSINPAVREKEARQEFLNEYNNLGIELVQFDKQEDAKVFYNKAKRDRNFWEEEKNKNPKNFKRIGGTVSLQFLIDIWKFPKDSLYRMMKTKVGEIYPSVSIYKGYGVCRILEKRPADESGYKKSKDSYYEKVKRRKKYDALSEWLKDLKKQAKIKIYQNTFVEGSQKGG